MLHTKETLLATSAVSKNHGDSATTRRLQLPELPTQSPFDRTPNEILSLILSFCPYSPEEAFAIHKSPSTSWGSEKRFFVSLYISHVSRRWRAVAKSMPFLWTMIPVLLNNTIRGTLSPARANRIDNAVHHYLHSSRNLPLNIVLIGPAKPLPSSTFREARRSISKDFDNMSPVIRSLRYQSRRWASFHACLFPNQFDSFDLHLQFPLLEKLCLTALADDCPGACSKCEIDEDVMPALCSAVIRAAPTLRRLELSGFEIIAASTHSDLFRTTPLEYIVYDRTYLSQAAALLNSVSSTTTVALKNTICEEFNQVSACTLSAHSLRLVTPLYSRESNTECSFKELFEHLTIDSSVKELEIVFDDLFAFLFPLVAIKSCLVRSPSAAITKLTLRFVPCSAKHLLQLLASLPSLTHIAMEEYTSDTLDSHHRLAEKPLPLSYLFFIGLGIRTKGVPAPRKRKPNSDRILKAVDDSSDEDDSDDDEERQLEHFGPDDESFVIRWGMGPLVPRLTHLALVFRFSPVCIEVVQMIKSRRGSSTANGVAVAGLERVCIRHGWCPVSSKFLMRTDTQSKLLALENKTLKMDLRYGYKAMEEYW